MSFDVVSVYFLSFCFLSSSRQIFSYKILLVIVNFHAPTLIQENNAIDRCFYWFVHCEFALVQ